MAKEIDIEKIIKRVQNEADKKNERRFDGMMENLNDSFKKMEDLFKGIFQKLDSHEEQIGNALIDLNGIKIDIGKIRYDIAFDLDKKHFIDLDRRVRSLEKK